MDSESLLTAMGGNRPLLREMARLCLYADAPRLRAQLQSALEVGDCTGIEFAAHALKALVGQFHAKTARAVAAEIESAARDGHTDRAAAHAAVFEREFEKLAMVLRAIVENSA
jgi:HPt (histidine-containing phosphotransfer) domain-containing protein